LIQIKSLNGLSKQAICPFIQHLYGTIREQELTVVDWTDEQKAAFIAQQFQAQHHHYTTYYYDAAFETIIIR